MKLGALTAESPGQFVSSHTTDFFRRRVDGVVLAVILITLNLCFVATEIQVVLAGVQTKKLVSLFSAMNLESRG